MVRTACIGFTRNCGDSDIGEVVKDYLSGKIEEQQLFDEAKRIRDENLKLMKSKGVDIIPSNDSSFYDRMLDTTCLLGNVQRRFFWEGGRVPLNIYFSMAFGKQQEKMDARSLELQNWMNTQYLYYVPEFVDPIDFNCSDNKPIVEYIEAKQLGIDTLSTILGPMSYILMGKIKDNYLTQKELLEEILPVYQEIFLNYDRIGVKQIQIEEPMLVSDLTREQIDLYKYCYDEIAKFAGEIKIHLVSYNGDITENFDLINILPVNSIHIDICSLKSDVNDLISKMAFGKKISIGLVDANSLFINDLQKSIDIAKTFCDKFGDENVVISTSAPLFNCPYSTQNEKLPKELKGKLAFAVEKLDELNIIKNAINNGISSVKKELAENETQIKELKNLAKPNKIKVIDIDKKTSSHGNKFEQLVKKYKLQTPLSMITGVLNVVDDKGKELNSLDLQKEAGLSVWSCHAGKNNYDISFFGEKSDGFFTLQHNKVPRFGYEYYYPTIIYKTPTVDKKIFSSVSKVKRNAKIPLKFAVPGPLSVIKSAFVNPYFDEDNLLQNVCDGMISAINEVAKDFDILQLNSFEFARDFQVLHTSNVDKMRVLIKKLNAFCTRSSCGCA